MSFIQLSVIQPSPEISDILIAELSDLGFDGFEERDNELICSIAESDYHRNEVSSILKKYQVEYTQCVLKEQNWNAVWESNFEPVVVDDFCAIRAEFHPHFPEVQQEIIITPKMSFGTGHHATTYMMISQMRNINFHAKKVADFGTGTGILAILSEKLGADEVKAIDEDDWSIENAAENLESNQCKKIFLTKDDCFRAGEKFDIILANINRNIILANLSNLTTSLDTKGKVLLSGLLESDEADVTKECTNRGLMVENVVYRNNWISILLEHNSELNV